MYLIYRLCLVLLLLVIPTEGISKGLDEFGYKTPHKQKIYYCDYGCGNNANGPAIIMVGNDIVFQTQKDERGDYENFLWAGFPSSHGSIQLKGRGDNTFCLRWVIRVGSFGKHFVIDFTEPKAIAVGPFWRQGMPYNSDEVEAVYWGKTYALIKFKSLHSFKYYYKERTIIEE